MATRRPVADRPRTFGAALALALLATPSARAAASGEPGWRLSVCGVAIEADAVRLQRGVVIIDVAAVASPLGLLLAPAERGFSVIAADGLSWLARRGDRYLRRGSSVLPLATFIPPTSPSLELPAETVAALAGVSLEVDEDLRSIRFGHNPARLLSPPAPPPTRVAAAEFALVDQAGDVVAPAPSGASRLDAGWHGFTLLKSVEQMALYRGGEVAASTRERELLEELLPASHGLLLLRVGLGYVQGADLGAELGGHGSLLGLDTELDALLTIGERGFELPTGHLSVSAAEAGLRFEAGDIRSAIFSHARGLRLDLGGGVRRAPVVSYYAPSSRTSLDRHVLSLAQRVSLFERLTLEAELATDGSFMARSGLRAGRLSLGGFLLERAGERAIRRAGGQAALDLGGRARVQVAFNRALEPGRAPADWLSASIRAPLVAGVDLVLDVTDSRATTNASRLYSAGLNLPLGPARGLLRYEWGGRRSRSDADSPWLDAPERQLRGSLSYLVHPRARLHMELASRWREDGSFEQWEQLVGSFRVGRRTNLELRSGLPDVFDREQLDLKLAHGFSRGLSLSVEYGRPGAYQSDDFEPGEQRFKVILRKELDVATPVRGASLDGRVSDQLGQPLSGAPVRLGPYRALSDRDGRYSFRQVPAGEYELALDDAGLPADYASDGARHRLELGVSSREDVDLAVVPLRAIQGWVFVDCDGDGRRGRREGVAGALLLLGDRHTRSERDGSFGFYNLEPGPYTLRLSQLPSGLVVSGLDELAVALGADRSQTALSFQATEKRKPIVFQTAGERP